MMLTLQDYLRLIIQLILCACNMRKSELLMIFVTIA